MCSAVPDGVDCGLRGFRPINRLPAASLIIWLVEGRAGAGDGDANAMPLVEDDVCETDVPSELHGFVWCEKFLFVETERGQGNCDEL